MLLECGEGGRSAITRLPVFLRQNSNEAWSVAAIAAIIAATFATDILTPPGVAAGVFPYFIAVFLTVRLPWQFVPYIVAAVAAVLALAGFYLSPGGRPDIVLINRVFIIVALYIVAYLAAHWIRASNLLVDRRAAAETESRYRDLFDTSPLGIQITDHNGTRLRINQTLADMLGYETTAEVLSLEQLGYIAPHDRPDALIRLKNDAAGGGPRAPYEIDLIRKDGSVFHAQIFWRPIDWQGRPATIRYFIDITERYRAEQARAESDTRYRNLFNDAPLGLHITDLDDNRLLVNQAFAEMLGYGSAAEIMALPPRAFIAPHEREAAMARGKWEIASGELSAPYELDLVRKDGTILTAEIFSLWIEWDNEPVIQRTVIDVTERYRAEQALAESAARYRDLFDGAELGQHIATVDGNRRLVNQAFSELLGYESPAEVMALSPFSFIAPHERAAAKERARREAAGDGPIESYEIDFIRKDDTILRVEVFSRRLDWEGAPSIQRTSVDVTERYRAEQARAESDARYRDLFDGSRLGQHISDPHGQRLVINQAMADLLGYESTAEVMALPPFAFAAPHEHAAATARTMADAAQGVLPESYEIDLVRKDGAALRAQVYVRRIMWDGKPATQRTFIDVTERYRAEQARAESDARYRDRFDGSRLGQHISDPHGQRLVINQAMADLLGYESTAEFMALPPFAFAAPHEHAAATARTMADAAQDVLPESYEIDLVRKDGAALRAQVYVRRIMWDGKPATQRTFIDVTERYRAQNRLARNEARYRDLIEGSQLALQISDETGKSLMYNQAAVDLLGYESVAEMMAEEPGSMVAPYDRDKSVTMDRIYAADGELPDTYEIDLFRKDNSLVRAQVFWRVIEWDGAPALQRTFINVTDRFMAEQALAENEARLRLMLNAIGDGLLGLDDQGNCTFCNPVGVALLGFRDASEIVGKNMHALCHSRYPDGSPYPVSACGINRSYIENRVTEGSDETFWRADGTPVPIAYRALPIRNDDAVVGAVVTICDMTRPLADAAARKAQDETIRALQRELSQAARESALGELSSVIAHELSQPLTAIRSTANAAKRQLDGTAPGKLDTLAEMLPFLSEQAERAGKVIDGIRRMFERDTPERHPGNLHDVIDEACLLARREFSTDGVTIEWTPGADRAPVIIDRIQIQQVIYNLIKNAAEAMAGLPEKTVSVSTAKTGRRTIEVAVSDTGPGIAPDARARLFEPFVTTKDYGMGMGLHTCRTVVEAHGGEIGVDPAGDSTDRSDPDRTGSDRNGAGATVRFTLRLAE